MAIRIGAVLFASIFLAAGGNPDQSKPAIDEAATKIGRIDSSELIARGEALYERRCAACHSIDQNRVGPKHRGVYGRKAGSVPDFRYSRALRDLDIIWTEETLDAWLESPTTFAPGTSMGFRLVKPEERLAVIAYLRSLSDNGD